MPKPSQEQVIQMSIENVKKFGVNYLTDSNEETQYHYLSAHNEEANGYVYQIAEKVWRMSDKSDWIEKGELVNKRSLTEYYFDTLKSIFIDVGFKNAVKDGFFFIRSSSEYGPEIIWMFSFA